MKKVFFLSSCSTCQRILKLLPLPSDIELIDIKLSAISDHDLDEIAKQ
jgi:arsenate reductase